MGRRHFAAQMEKVLYSTARYIYIASNDSFIYLFWKFSHVENGLVNQSWADSSIPFLFNTSTDRNHPASLMTPQEDIDLFFDTMQVSTVSLERNCLNQFSVSHPDTRNVQGKLAVSQDSSRLRSNSAPDSSPSKCRHGCKPFFPFQSSASAHYLMNCPNHLLTPKPY